MNTKCIYGGKKMNLKNHANRKLNKLRPGIIVVLALALVFGAFQSAAFATFSHGGGAKDNPGTLQLLKPGYIVFEGLNQWAGFTVFRTGGSKGTVTVDYCLCEGTAKRGKDFAGKSGKITFGPGELVKVVNVKIMDDKEAEGTEHFKVTLKNPKGGAKIGVVDHAQINIIDNDHKIGGGFKAGGDIQVKK
jgi:hypothetical protein